MKDWLQHNKLNKCTKEDRFWIQECHWAIPPIVTDHRLEGESRVPQPSSLTVSAPASLLVKVFILFCRHRPATSACLPTITCLEERPATKESFCELAQNMPQPPLSVHIQSPFWRLNPRKQHFKSNSWVAEQIFPRILQMDRRRLSRDVFSWLETMVSKLSTAHY